MPFRLFTRTWYADAACTKPKPGKRTYTGQTFTREEDAQTACRLANSTRTGGTSPNRGPRGLATEYEQTR